jgi:hypothetical protein
MRHPAPWLGWSAWLLAAASLTLVFGLFVWRNDTLAAPDNTEWVLGSLPSLAFVTVGAVVVARRPGNRIGWLCYGIGLGQILAGFGGPAATSALAAGPSPGPIWLVAYELGELCWELTWTLLAMLLLLFPTGQLPSPRWRPVAWAAGAVLVLAAFSGPFLPGPPAPGLPPNPIAIPALAGLLRVAYAAGGVVVAGVILAALVSLIVRFRRARGVERQQLKWFAYGTALLLFLPVAGILGASLAVRHRPADQPYPGLRAAHRRAGRGLCRGGADLGAGVRRDRRRAAELGGGQRHPGRCCPVPAGSPPRPGRGGPAL